MKFSNKKLRGNASLRIPEKSKLSDYQKAMITVATSSSPHHAAMRILEKKADKPVLRAGLDVEFSLPDGTRPKGKIAKVLDDGDHVLIASQDLTTYKVPYSRVSVSKDAMKQMVKSAFVQQKFKRCGELQYDQKTGYYYATISSFYSPSDKDIYRYASHEFEGYEVIDAVNKNSMITLVMEKTAQKISSELEQIVGRVLDHLTSINPGIKFTLKASPTVKENCITANFQLLSEDDEAVFISNGKFTKEASSTVAKGKIEINEDGYHTTLLNAPFHVYGLLHEEDKTAEDGGDVSTGWSEFSEEDLKEEAVPGGRVLPLVRGLPVGKTIPIVKGKPGKKKNGEYESSDGPVGTMGDNDEYREDHLREADEDPCWDGYEQVGVKDKGGKKVPNCVPKKDGFIDLTAEDEEEGEETDPNAVKPPKDTDTDKHFTYDALDQYGEQVYERYLKDAPDFVNSITNPSVKKNFEAAIIKNASKHESDIRALNGNMVDFVTAVSFASIVKMAEKKASPEYAVDEATAEILKGYLGDLGEYYAKINSNIKRYAKNAFKVDGVNLDEDALDAIVSIINARNSRRAHRKTAQLKENIKRWMDNLGRGRRDEVSNLSDEEVASTALEQARFFPEIENLVNRGIVNFLRSEPTYIRVLMESMGDDVKYDTLSKAIAGNSKLKDTLQTEIDKMLSKQDTGFKQTWSDLPARALERIREMGMNQYDRKEMNRSRREQVRNSMAEASKVYREKKRHIEEYLNSVKEQYKNAPPGTAEQRRLSDELGKLQSQKSELERTYQKEMEDIKSRGGLLDVEAPATSPEEDFFGDDTFTDSSPSEEAPMSEAPKSEPDIDLTEDVPEDFELEFEEDPTEPEISEELDLGPVEDSSTPEESETPSRKQPPSEEERQRVFDEARENLNRPVSEDAESAEEAPSPEAPSEESDVIPQESPKPKRNRKKKEQAPKESGAWSSRGRPSPTFLKGFESVIANTLGIDESKASEIRKSLMESLKKWDLKNKEFYDEAAGRTNLQVNNPGIADLFPKAFRKWKTSPEGEKFMSTLEGKSSEITEKPKSKPKSTPKKKKKEEAPKPPPKEEKEDADFDNLANAIMDKLKEL